MSRSSANKQPHDDALSETVSADDYTRGLKPFQPGQTGNPGGKPVGARNRLTARFLNDLAKHYAEEGHKAIDRLCQDDPAGYVKVIAALCPKEVEIKRPLEDMNADELLAAVRALEGYLAAQPAPEGTGETRQ